jgi:hypothetical protein
MTLEFSGLFSKNTLFLKFIKIRPMVGGGRVFPCGETAVYRSVGKESKNSIFCIDSEFLCLVYTSEKKVTISLYSMKILNFLTERQSVYYAVRARSLNVVQVVLVLERLVLSSYIRVDFTKSFLKAP